MHKNEDYKKLGEIVEQCWQHYQEYAQPEQDYAREVHNMIHGNIDWGSKKPHNAKIHLNKLGIAQDNWKATVKKGLMTFDQWMKVKLNTLMESEVLSEFNVQRMLDVSYRDENLKAVISDGLGLGFVENRVAFKLIPKVVSLGAPGGKSLKSFRLSVLPLDLWEFAQDPDVSNIEQEKGLYQIHQFQIPKYQLLKLSSDEPTLSKPYIKSLVQELSSVDPERDSEHKEAKGENYIRPSLSRKKLITVKEFWGTVLDENGEVMEVSVNGEKMLLEDVMFAVAGNCTVISNPVKISSISINNSDYFVSFRLLRNNRTLLGRAMGHAGYELNRALDEYVSAMADAGMKAGINMTAYKPDMFVDPEEAAGGFTYDSNVALMPDANPSDAIQSIPLGNLPPTMFNVYGILDSAFAENVSKNGPALSGALPGKQVKATEAAIANNTVAALDESILADVEDIGLEVFIRKSFELCLQFAEYFSDEDLDYIFADDIDGRAGKKEAFKKLARNKAKLFSEFGCTFRFRGTGLRSIVNQNQKAQQMMNLYLSLLGNPASAEDLKMAGVSSVKILESALKAFGSDPEELKDSKVAENMRELMAFREIGRGIALATGGGGQLQRAGAKAQQQNPGLQTQPGNNGLAQ